MRVIQLPDPEMTEEASTSLKRLRQRRVLRKRNLRRPIPSQGFPSGQPSEEFLLKIRELKAFKELYHDCHVPKTLWDNQELGRWVAEQKARYSLRWMTVEERELLRDNDFVWTRNIVWSSWSPCRDWGFVFRKMQSGI